MRRKRTGFAERYSLFLNTLREQIATGELQPGDYILPENDLGEVYGLSRVSVRKALAELVQLGMIEKIAGKGNRVVELPGREGATVIKLGWFATSREIPIIQKMLTSFEQIYPYVKVELQLIPDDGYTEEIIQLIELGQAPDVFMMSDLHMRQWIDAKKTEFLDGYVPSHVNDDHVYPSVLRLFQYEDRMLGAPFLFTPVVICYNKEHFKEQSIDADQIRTWDDLVRVAQACSKTTADGRTVQYGFSFSSSYNRWPIFMLQNEGKFTDESGKKSLLMSDANVQALEFCAALLHDHRVASVFSHANSIVAENLFSKGHVSMIMTTYFYLNEFRSHAMKWDIFPLPSQRKKATFLLGGSLAMNARSEHKKIAQKLIDFMTGSMAQTLLKTYGTTIPALREIAEDTSLHNPSIHPQHYDLYKAELAHAVPLIELGVPEHLLVRMMYETDLLWANVEKPEETCRRLDQLLQQELNK